MDAKVLEHVFRNHPDSVNNKGIFKGLLYDYFPTERSEVRLLLSAYEAGIAGEIAQHRMDESFVHRMTQRLSESYGLEQRKAEQAVLLWCEAYGKGILEKECNIKQHPVQEGKQSAAAGRAKKSFDYSTICWNSDHTIRIAVPDRPKKITGTRLPDILGMNSFRTPFETWCSVMRLFEEPFSENKYTRAGKIIEPKQCEYMKQYANAGIRVVSPADIYGTDYFNKTHGDFFSSTDIFGGMWDFLAQQNGLFPRFWY